MIEFTDGNFDTEVINSEIPVLVDFAAVWCGPCKAMAPTVEALATDYEGRIKIGKMDIDQNPSTGTSLTVIRYSPRGSFGSTFR